MLYTYAMKRTTIFLPDQMLRRLQGLAQRKQVSTATLVREAVIRYLDAPSSTAGLPSIAGKFASGRGDTSERADALLWRDPHA